MVGLPLPLEERENVVLKKEAFAKEERVIHFWRDQGLGPSIFNDTSSFLYGMHKLIDISRL